MRTLLCTAIVLAACAPGDGSRASTSAGPAHKYAGTWEGRSFRSASDTGTPWRIVTAVAPDGSRSEEHTSELQSRLHLVCRLLLEKKKTKQPRGRQKNYQKHTACHTPI